MSVMIRWMVKGKLEGMKRSIYVRVKFADDNMSTSSSERSLNKTHLQSLRPTGGDEACWVSLPLGKMKH